MCIPSKSSNSNLPPVFSSLAASNVQEGRVKPKLLLSPNVRAKEGNQVLISGAGIAGLASAIALSNIGIASVVLEQRSEKEILSRAGINLQPRAVEDLNELGVSTATLLEVGNTITKQSYYFPDGRHVSTLVKSGGRGQGDSGKAAEPGQIAIHRGALMQLLLNVAASKDNIKVLNNHSVRNFDQGQPDAIQVAVRVGIEKGVGGAEGYCSITNKSYGADEVKMTGSMLLGADGIHSNIRKQIMAAKSSSGDDSIHHHGVTHYRGVADNFPRFLDGHTMIVAGGLLVKAVVYPITRPNEDGRQSINWVIAVNDQEDKSPSQSGTLKDRILDILSSNEFDLGFLDLKDLISKTPDIKAWPLIDLEPLESWTCGRVCLIGDAAHAMLPVGSGGAMAAITDALMLRDAFTKSGPVFITQVLRLYHQLRYKWATMHQQKCRMQPGENIVQEAMDSVGKCKSVIEVPQEYDNRVREAMKALHTSLDPNSDAAKETQKRVLVIGAGASGLSAAKEFSEKGLSPVVFEAGPCLGGVFRDAYPELILTTSSIFTAFSDYPPTEDEPTMWTAAEYLSYLHNYCLDNNLFQYIQFNATVVGIRRINHPDNTSKLWEVTKLDKNTGDTTQLIGGHLVVSIGSNATPNSPSFDGQSSFGGKILHTSELPDSFEMFRNKRVLCLGIGESGSDLPYHIAKQHGAKVTVAMRGMGWMVPRRRPLKVGAPTDVNTSRMLWGLPRFFNRTLCLILAFLDSRLDPDPVIRLMGKMNLKHPVGVYKTYGTKSISFLYAIVHHGAKLIESSIQSMGPGNLITFGNGQQEEFDIVLLNTGYKKANFQGFCFPSSMKDHYDEALFKVLSEASYPRNLFKRVVHPAMDNLYFVGFARPGFASIPAIAETHARWAASLAACECNPLPSEDEMLSEIAADKYREENQFDGVASRVPTLVDYLPHVNDIGSLLGATPPFLEMLFTDPSLLFKVMFGPATVVQLRLKGPDAKPDLAISTIKNYPPVPMRRLTYIATGLYLTSLVLLAFSVLVPLSYEGRKSLQPVGFAPVRNHPFLLLRYFLFWVHTLALAYFYASSTHVVAGLSIVAIICFLEFTTYVAKEGRKEYLRKTLTSSDEVRTGIFQEKNSALCPYELGTCSSLCQSANPLAPGKKTEPKRGFGRKFGYGTFTVTTVLSIGLAVAMASCQRATGFQHPNNMGMLKKRLHESCKTVKPLLESNVDLELLSALTKTHSLTPTERMVLTCSGTLQDAFSAHHLKPVQVKVNYCDLVVDESKSAETSMADRFPLATYDRNVEISICGSTVCNATSKVRVYDTALLEMLNIEQIGIGQLLKMKNLLPEFILHDAGRNEKDGGLWRFYSLICSDIEFDILEEFTPDSF